MNLPSGNSRTCNIACRAHGAWHASAACTTTSNVSSNAGMQRGSAVCNTAYPTPPRWQWAPTLSAICRWLRQVRYDRRAVFAIHRHGQPSQGMKAEHCPNPNLTPSTFAIMRMTEAATGGWVAVAVGSSGSGGSGQPPTVATVATLSNKRWWRRRPTNDAVQQTTVSTPSNKRRCATNDSVYTVQQTTVVTPSNKRRCLCRRTNDGVYAVQQTTVSTPSNKR